jgi:pSer/pThr/pTyr-binding forkhead associated (FHA) protein
VKPAVLVIQPQGKESRVHTVVSEQTLIGRGPSCDIKLPDTGISREHAVITWDGDHYAIEDLQSTNGTRVNERRIRSVDLQSDDRIQIGHTIITFRLEG